MYSILHEVANEHGYALAVHGSMKRDFDILAVPWVESPSTTNELFEAIKNSTAKYFIEDEKLNEPTEQPHGRISYSIPVDGGYYLDLSIMKPLTPYI
jgi:hypothetical protein